MNFLKLILPEPKDITNHKASFKENKKLSKIPINSYPIKCHNGVFLGKNEENIISYKGIPFAKPPVKQLRWHPPVDCDNSEDIYEAFHFAKSPIQTNDPGEKGSFYEIGEDCLYLNIWKNNDNIKNKAVMVFVHGGAFGWGATNDPLYNGHNFVKAHKDIIIVTITYRVSIFGFLDLTKIKGGESYKESPNLGLLDQIQALKWVNKNIENFGGDKNNVTIFGESAGALSVTVLPLIKGSKGLFKRVISQSGTFVWGINKEDGEPLVEKFITEVRKYNPHFDINYLLQLPEKDLIKINSNLNSYCLPPMRDGYVVPKDCFKAIEDGAYDGLDILIGTNSDEVNYWLIECGDYYYLFKFFLKVLLENIIKYRVDENQKNIFEKYKKIQPEKPNENFLSDLFFRVPAVKIADIHSKKNGNVFLYYWTYPSAVPNYGACHSIELFYVFNNMDERHKYGDYWSKMVEVTQEMWSNFAKNGNPSTRVYKWDKYTEKEKNCMFLGEEIGIKKNIFKERDKIVEPLIYKYIPYDYSILSLNVPFVWKSLFFICAIFVLIVGFLIRKKISK